MVNFRFVLSDSDYADWFQCLGCKEQFTAQHYRPYKYCPWCGESFIELIKCRPHTTPKWEWEYAGEAGLPSHIRDIEYRIQREQSDKDTRKWTIQSRSLWPKDKDWSEWKTEREFKSNECTAKNILWYYKEYYRDDPDCYWKTEYRILRQTKGTYNAN